MYVVTVSDSAQYILHSTYEQLPVGFVIPYISDFITVHPDRHRVPFDSNNIRYASPTPL